MPGKARPIVLIAAEWPVSPGVALGSAATVEDGSQLFRWYCVSCHGAEGRETAPRQPARRSSDLTRLAKQPRQVRRGQGTARSRRPRPERDPRRLRHAGLGRRVQTLRRGLQRGQGEGAHRRAGGAHRDAAGKVVRVRGRPRRWRTRPCAAPPPSSGSWRRCSAASRSAGAARRARARLPPPGGPR